MKILVCDTKMISTLQQQFHEKFPHLKIEFFAKKHRSGQASDSRDKIDPERLLSEFRFKHNSETIEILPEMTVSQLEEQFWDIFGLSVQVFRLAGDDWIETIVTDDWTLAKQEEMAKKHDGQNEANGEKAAY